ncbi:flagellar export protein FliJ [Neorhodopirellula lusitana]|nr:flagellar export protein FliJ [Neorhodopirellula lusitana]
MRFTTTFYSPHRVDIMAFQFRFDSLLQLRERQRDEVGNEVGKANEAIRRVDEQIEQLQQERDQLRAQAAGVIAGQTQTGTTDATPTRPANLSVDRMLQQGRYDLQLQTEQMSLRQTRGTLMQELDRRQTLLVAAEAEVKKLERLRETRQTEHTKLQLQREQAEADDLTTARMVIARRNAARTLNGDTRS